jgi:hypothetical protein
VSSRRRRSRPGSKSRWRRRSAEILGWGPPPLFASWLLTSATVHSGHWVHSGWFKMKASRVTSGVVLGPSNGYRSGVTTAVASISMSRSGAMSRVTSIMLLAGRMVAKTSP